MFIKEYSIHTMSLKFSETKCEIQGNLMGHLAQSSLFVCLIDGIRSNHRRSDPKATFAIVNR